MDVSPNIIGILGFFILFVLIFLRMPLVIAFGIVGFVGFAYVLNVEAAFSTLITTIWTYGTSYVLMAAPLFILMGQFASYSKIGDELYSAAETWMGKLPGGLAIATIWGSAGFAACTGSSGTGILTFAPISYPPMKKSGYDMRLILGTLCCGSTMGTLIPPSITFIIYGSITDESVGRLFMAGIIPGILEAILYCILIILFSTKNIWPAPAGSSTTWKQKFISLKGVWGFLSLMILVIGGIYQGFFTPTEAAGVGALGSLIILVVRKGFQLKLFKAALMECLQTGCMALSIVIAAVVFSRFIALTGLNNLVIDFISNTGASPMVILILILTLMFVMGFVMPVTSILVLIVPFVYPIVTAILGFDGIWFGVLVCTMAEIALITPPIGMNLFITLGLFSKETTAVELFQSVMPFVIADLIRLVLLMIFPALCMWLPTHM
jgi:C4-dicarboxylate transporter DctM subunit